MIYRLHFTAFMLSVLNHGLGFNIAKHLFVKEDALLNFTQLAYKYGHTAEEYEVITKDGYILGLFRIPGFKTDRPQRRLPLLLMHGLFDSSDTWVIRGNNSLGITLANVGFDVWCGNSRGNKYSRRHVHLDPDKDNQFWNFSFDEHGLFDLPSTIDFVLNMTGAEKLNAIGHSQGNTLFYVLGSSIPEYNRKVSVVIALAPVCYLQYVGLPLRKILKLSTELYGDSQLIGLRELPGKALSKTLFRVCSLPIIGYVECILGLSFPFTGYDAAEVEPPFLRVAVGHFPMATSGRNLYHYAQVATKGTFAKYDYGQTRNVEVYGSEVPPSYALRNVAMRVVLLVGGNDYIATVKDVASLREQLPNVVEYAEIERPQMNHIDFIWGRHMEDYLFPHIFSSLYKYLY